MIELRRYSISIVAESHLRTTKHYIKNEVPILIGSIRLWAEAGPEDTNVERKK